MIICFSGAHRTGKTTLAKASAASLDGTYVEVNLSEAQRKAGFDSSNQSYSFDDRIKIQEILLGHMSKLMHVCSSYPEAILFLDRSPMDLVMYTMSLIQSKGTTPEQDDWAMGFIKRCQELTNHYVDVIIGVQTGIPLVNGNTTSAVCSEAYVEHLNLINLGTLYSLNGRTLVYVMHKDTLTLEARLAYVRQVGAMYSANKSKGN